jgi:hypothetical protein
MDRLSTPLAPEIHKRVLYAKLLLRRAIRTQEEKSDPSFAISVLLLHDAVEMLMVSVTDKLHLKAPSQFSDFWKTLVEKGHAEPPYRNAMERLNKTRVGFKHHGIIPNSAVAREFVTNSKAFCEDVSKTYLDLDFDSLSLADLIENPKARNLLKQSQEEFTRGEKDEAFGSLRKSFDIILAELRIDIPLVKNSSGRTPHLPENIGIRQLDGRIRDLNKYLEAQNQFLTNLTITVNMMMLGADLQRYSYFVANTPIVQYAYSGDSSVIYSKTFESVDESVFVTCYEFVVDFALQTATLFRPATAGTSVAVP